MRTRRRGRGNSAPLEIPRRRTDSKVSWPAPRPPRTGADQPAKARRRRTFSRTGSRGGGRRRRRRRRRNRRRSMGRTIVGQGGEHDAGGQDGGRQCEQNYAADVRVVGHRPPTVAARNASSPVPVVVAAAAADNVIVSVSNRRRHGVSFLTAGLKHTQSGLHFAKPCGKTYTTDNYGYRPSLQWFPPTH